MIVAFRYHVELSDSWALDVFVTPGYGFYAFLVATCLSLAVGHLLVLYHRRAEFPRDLEASPQERLLDHSFQVGNGEMRLSPFFQAFVLTLMLAVIALLGVGITRESFVFEFGGLAGMVVEDWHSSYSLLSLGSALPDSVENPSSIGIQALRVVYYFYAVVTPFACIFFLFLLLVCPLTTRRQLQLLTLAEISNAWSAAEVFALSIAAAVLEISTFAKFVVGHRCDMVNEILRAYFDNEDSTCYTLKSDIRWDAIYLVAGVLLNSFLVSFVLRIAHVSMDERIHQLQQFEKREWMNGLLSTEERNAGRTFVQRIWNCGLTSWIFCTKELVDMSDAGPPVISEEILSPWQKEDVFSREWKIAAERDPSWKEWKEATNVT
jgi:hypothetical protein